MKRRTGRLAVCCLLGILAAAFAALGLSACSGGRWDIAAGADSTVTAQLVETENGTELRIGGRGEMRDFEEGGRALAGPRGGDRGGHRRQRRHLHRRERLRRDRRRLCHPPLHGHRGG